MEVSNSRKIVFSILIVINVFNILLILGSNFDFFISSDFITGKTAADINLTIFPRPIVILSPQNITYASLPIQFEIKTSENSTAYYSIDSGATNASMNANASKTGFTASTSSIANGAYTANYYVNDTAGNRNDTESTPFSVSVSRGITAKVTGGGGGEIKSAVNFTINKDLIDIKLKQGETERETIIIKNTGDKIQQFSLEIQGKIRIFIILSDESFSLSPQESKEINADFFASENEKPEIYAGRIIIKIDPVTKAINTILEIKQKIALFDIKSELADISIAQTQKINANINMKDIGDLNKRVDVNLEYFIRDFEGTEIKLAEETIGVFGSLDINRKFPMPIGLVPGDYLLIIKLSYLDNVATSANRFTMIEELPFVSFIKQNYPIILIISIILMLLILFILKKPERTLEEIEYKIKNTENKIYVAYLRAKYSIYLVMLKSRPYLAKTIYPLRKILDIIYVGYLKIRYVPFLIKAKYEAGLYKKQIAAIKHLPQNIIKKSLCFTAA